MTFTSRDAKNVSTLIAKKLELYINYERRETHFDPLGHLLTTPRMHAFDLMHQMLDKMELKKKSQRHSRDRAKQSQCKPSVRKDKTNVKNMLGENQENIFEDNDLGNCLSKTKNDDGLNDDERKNCTIHPYLLDNSRRVVSRKEAGRITKFVNEVFKEQDLDKLHVIHRYRPHSKDIPAVTENGKVANYTIHVGSALNSKYYVDYYLREGLQTGNKEYAKRLQNLKIKKQKFGHQEKPQSHT